MSLLFVVADSEYSKDSKTFTKFRQTKTALKSSNFISLSNFSLCFHLHRICFHKETLGKTSFSYLNISILPILISLNRPFFSPKSSSCQKGPFKKKASKKATRKQLEKLYYKHNFLPAAAATTTTANSSEHGFLACWLFVLKKKAKFDF